jgi:hypothetical protein
MGHNHGLGFDHFLPVGAPLDLLEGEALMGQIWLVFSGKRGIG